MDGRSASRKLLSLCYYCSDRMLRILISVQNNFVSFNWIRTGAKHTTRLFIDSFLTSAAFCMITQCLRASYVKHICAHIMQFLWLDVNNVHMCTLAHKAYEWCVSPQPSIYLISFMTNVNKDTKQT